MRKLLPILLSAFLVIGVCPGLTFATQALTALRAQEAADTQVMHRLYNPNSGEHFYTANDAERDAVAAAGWNYEGEGWTAPVSSSTPVYRLYSGTDHHYCMDEGERNALIGFGWADEGIGWYSDDEQGVPLYRQFNPNVDPAAPANNSGSHNYTVDLDEHLALVSVGWNDEGVGWYGVKTTASAPSNPEAPSAPTNPSDPSTPSDPDTSSTPSTPGSSGGSDQIVYKDGVKVLSSTEAWNFNKSNYSACVADGSKLKVGDIVVVRPDTKSGDYFGGEICITRIDTSVTPNVVYGKAPSPEDVYASIHVDTTTSGVAKVEPNESPLSAMSQDSRGVSYDDWSWGLKETFPGSGTLEFNISANFEGDDKGEELSFSVNGTVTPSADIAIDFDGISFSHLSIVNTSTASISVSGELSQSVNPIQLGRVLLPSPVPGLALWAQLNVEFGVQGEIELGVTFTAEAGFDASADGLTPIWDSQVVFEGNASVKMGLDCIISVEAWLGAIPLADFSVVTGPHVGVQASTRSVESPKVCIDGSSWLDLSVGFSQGNGVFLKDSEWTVLGSVADQFHFELPYWELLKNDDDNPFRYDFMHYEDGDFVPECTYWNLFSTEPAWTDGSSYLSNVLGEPFVVRAGTSITFGDQTDERYVTVGGLGINLAQYRLYNLDSSHRCILRVTGRDDNGVVCTRFVTQAPNFKSGISYQEGAEKDNWFLDLQMRNLTSETTIEVLKGTLYFGTVQAGAAPHYTMGECEQVDSMREAIASLESQPPIPVVAEG